MKYKAPAYKDLIRLRGEWFKSRGYKYEYWENFDYTALDRITWLHYRGKGSDRITINDAIIMADTETSKKHGSEENHIVCWTVSIRACNVNICTLYGRKPSDFCRCVDNIVNNMPGNRTIIYFHNLSYDYGFLRKFLYAAWGYPVRCLNTKPYYPISMEFENGVIIRDSLILAQRSLEKWAADMGVEHQKAIGSWDYDKYRNQSDHLSDQELLYIEYDTLAGVECIDAMLHTLNKRINTIPYTATGIPREQVRKLAKANRGRDMFMSMVMTYEDYIFAESVYHGGYVHANRHEIGWINPAICYDFASSYPFVMLSEKYPMERFTYIGDANLDDILRQSADYAFMFRLIMVRPRLKKGVQMPALQWYKCQEKINAIQDNGRVLYADYIEINVTELDLDIILRQYDYDLIYIKDCHAARKDYLPRWFTDYIFDCFRTKTMLKGGDPVLYAIAKSIVNALYGMCVQKSIRDTINEDYETGDYSVQDQEDEDLYQQYLDNKNNVLPYQWGVWVTAYAFRNLFDLGSCVAEDGIWLYSDTDSCYATAWDQNRIEQYNKRCRDRLRDNGYGAVEHNGRAYWLGVAELDGTYSEFVAQGAKRYACRDAGTGKVKITVAGVPKSGAACLDNDLHNFKPGLIFPGSVTGKLTHKHIYVDEIYTDSAGNETGDSINLEPCDYLLSSVNSIDWSLIDEEEIYIQVYDRD